MSSRRILRLNNLLQEVISETIQKEVKNPHVGTFVSVARVDLSSDLHHARVYLSMIGDPAMKEKTLAAIRSAAGFIAVHSSKKVKLRYFPTLSFFIDETVDRLMHIEEILQKVRPPEGERSS